MHISCFFYLFKNMVTTINILRVALEMRAERRLGSHIKCLGLSPYFNQCLTFRNFAFNIQDGRKITLQMPHFIFIQQISILNILNMLYNLHFFSSKCRLFHIATLFGICITHILNTGCAKTEKKIRHQKVNLHPIIFGSTSFYNEENVQNSQCRIRVGGSAFTVKCVSQCVLPVQFGLLFCRLFYLFVFAFM